MRHWNGAKSDAVNILIGKVLRTASRVAVFELRGLRTTECNCLSVPGIVLHTLKVKAAGDFGEHGQASSTAQNGRLALFGKNTLVTAWP